jgi:hypothetical protein
MQFDSNNGNYCYCLRVDKYILPNMVKLIKRFLGVVLPLKII